jgi:hypothetical protein
MNLNSMTLPDTLVAELYPSAIIDINTAKTAGPLQQEPVTLTGDRTARQEPELKPAVTYLGNNRKNILILAEEKEAPELRDKALDFLTGILNACKLSLEDVAVINRAAYPELSYKELVARLQPKVILLFDITPTTLDLPLDFPHFQIQPFSGVSYLSSPGLAELENDKLLKSKLWVSLKRLFNI